ncbi:MAG: hypothetical protein A2066_21710 [Bacteroidetes bacterium GWB2_41_8]|nr:MAG: hypothetical protein A2066_21710 [Bacteroidetes bacterium GWB2_41_8]
MYVEILTTDLHSRKARFAIQDLTSDELELLQSGLIEVKHSSLQDAEVFREQRASCDEMFQKIDKELRNSRS